MKETPFLDHAHEAIDSLRHLSFLSQMSEKHLQSIFRMSRIRYYERDEVVIQEGACDSFLYILLSGEVKIVKHGTVVSWLRQAGDVFGELAVIDFLPRSATAIALGATSCLAMDAACFDALPPADQAVIYAILYKSLAQVVTERLRSTSDELASLKRGIMAGAGAEAA